MLHVLLLVTRLEVRINKLKNTQRSHFLTVPLYAHVHMQFEYNQESLYLLVEIDHTKETESVAI